MSFDTRPCLHQTTWVSADADASQAPTSERAIEDEAGMASRWTFGAIQIAHRKPGTGSHRRRRQQMNISERPSAYGGCTLKPVAGVAIIWPMV
ncbi:MAG TPA: hypothetical protein VIM34_09290 [Burkholderiaceae bacterium]